MRISYSGINLEVVHLVNFERVPVLSDDSVDYLFTKFTITAIGLVSSDQIDNAIRFKQDDTIGMSFNRANPRITDLGFGLNLIGNAIIDSDIGLPTSVVHTPESTPIITDLSIRHWLSVPRRRLIITDENPGGAPTTLLQSPKLGFIVDAHNGPFPEVFAIQQVFGDAKLFMVSLQVTTYVNECEENVGVFGAFLSNRFSQSHNINEDGYITIKTDGEARFRTDLIYNKLNPDLLRPFLFLPIPNGFKRKDIIVEGISDVSGFKYSFIDEQIPQHLVIGDEIGATRVEATYRQAIATNEDALGTILQGVSSVSQSLLNNKWLREKNHPPVLPPGPPPLHP